jgi:hypothetical protein
MAPKYDQQETFETQCNIPTQLTIEWLKECMGRGLKMTPRAIAFTFANRGLTANIIQFVMTVGPNVFQRGLDLDVLLGKEYLIEYLWRNRCFKLEHLHAVLEHLKTTDDLELILPSLSDQYLVSKLTLPMLTMLYEFIPLLDVAKSYNGSTPILIKLIDWNYYMFNITLLNEQITRIKLLSQVHEYNPTIVDKYPAKTSLEGAINWFVSKNQHLDPVNNPVIFLIELCPNLFRLINQAYLTQELSNTYYLSCHWTRIGLDFDQLKQLIPGKYYGNLTDGKFKPGLKTKGAPRDVLDPSDDNDQ